MKLFPRSIPTSDLDQMLLATWPAVTLRCPRNSTAGQRHRALEHRFPAAPRHVRRGRRRRLVWARLPWAADGWRRAADSLDGVYTIVSADNYLEQQLANVTTHPRMTRVPRGGTAPEVGFGVTSTGVRLLRFGLQFVLDEQDAIDGARIGLYRVALEEALRAARGMVSDLLWATILGNPKLADGKTLFHSDRGNLGNAAFSDTSLKAAYGAIAGQVDQGADGGPVHLNLQPRILVTSPNGLIAAREYIRPGILEGAEIIARAESRLSKTGVVDPVSGELLATSNDNHWLLAATGEQKPSIVLSLLNGQTEPRVRQFALDRGQWGIGFDVSFSCAAAALDGRPLYYSSADG